MMRLIQISVLTGLLCCAASVGAEKTERRNEDRILVRFEWDNDLAFQTDNGFTAGWGFSAHSPAMESWDETSKFSRWIGRTIPGLGSSATDDLKVKISAGFNQIIQTPEDLSNPNLQIDDVPYAGVLGAYVSWYTLNNERLRAFQIYGGILGSASGAEQVQKFIHNDLALGEDPVGWDNQLYNEPLLNLNYEAGNKLWSWGEVGTRKFSTDLAIFGGAGVGNAVTGADLEVQWRFGWGLPQGFVTIVGGTGRRIGMNPTIDVPHDKWSLYFSVAPRISAVAYTVVLDSNTFRDHPHPGVDYNHFPTTLIYGFHLSKKRFSCHWNATYHPERVVDVPTETATSWGSFSIEYLF